MSRQDSRSFCGSRGDEEPLVSVVVLNFNGGDVLRECLRSVSRTEYSDFEVIVVDNCSSDGSCLVVEREFPQFRLVRNSGNFGYSKGNNVGIACSRGDFVVLLNNDTVVTPGWLSELVREARRDPDCFYQPKILFVGSDRINSAGNCVQLFGFAFPRGLGEVDVGQYDGKCEVSYASGACVLASKRLVEDVGLLDEGFFTFYEDVNWGWRGLMRGFRTVYVPSAVVYHRWGSSWGRLMSSTKFFLIERGRLATILKNYSSRTLIVMLPLLFLIELIVLFYSLMKGFMSEKIGVYSNLIKNWGELLRKRREIQNIRRKSDTFVTSFFSEELTHPYLGGFSVVLSKLLGSLSRIVRPLIK